MFHEKLKKQRILKNFTQQEMADILKISRVAYTNYELAKREPDFETVKKISKVLEVSTDYLLDNTNDPTPPNKIRNELSLEEVIRNRTDLSEQSKRDMLMQLKLVKIRDMTEEKIAETEFNFRPAHC